MQVKTVKKICSNLFRLATGSRWAGLQAALMVIALAALVPAQVLAENAIPLVNQPLVPTATAPGGAAFTLTVNGSGFASGAVVNWNGSARATTVVSSAQVTAAILATDIATASTASITVTNPAPGGGTSLPTLFPVTKSTTGVFMARNDRTVNPSAMAVAAASFRSNGITDVAIANSSNSVDVLLGNGNGTFQAAVNYPIVSGYPIGIISADVNGDGHPDLVLLLNHTNMVQVLLGKGDGTFTVNQQFSTGNNPQWLTAADVNSDGKLDLLVANYKDNTVSVLLGNGDGTFQTKIPYDTGVNPDSLTVGDFNGDGLLDLAVTNANDNTVSILKGAGNGTFAAHVDYPTAGLPTDVVTADLNKDGKLDLAVSTASGNVSVLLGNGDGTFAAFVNYPVSVNPQMLVVADFNGDGNLDLANINYSNNSVSMLLGVGNGTFKAQANYPTSTAPGWLSVGDFNNDGRPDLAVIDTTAGGLTILSQSLLTVSPTILTFPKQEAGFGSTAMTVTLRNTSTATIGLGTPVLQGANAGDYSISANACTTSLAAGKTCTISFVFTPQDENSRTAQAYIPLTAGGSIGVGLFGTGQIRVAIEPDPHSFPTTLLGTTSPAFLANFHNYSNLTVKVDILELTGLDTEDYHFTPAATNGCVLSGPPDNSFSVGPVGTCYLDVYFEPTAAGSRTAALTTFGHFSPGNGQQAILMTGMGTGVSVKPTSLTFAAQTVGTTSPAKVVTVKNAGATALKVSITLQTGTPKDFAQTNNCNGSIPAGGSCTVNVTFTPLLTGAISSALYIGDSDPTGPQIVTLSGTGQ
jgi:hypothetical protein